MIAALFVDSKGPYANQPDKFDVWDESRDARKYAGPHRVIAHPPCQRWGRYWGGGPMLAGTDRQKTLGDDNGCFDSALSSVRTYGGVLEHPEASHAWKRFGLAKPPYRGGWIDAGDGYGITCCVPQGNYGHKGRKLTWLYAVRCNPLELNWTHSVGMMRMDDGFNSREHRAREVRTGAVQRLSKRQRLLTPEPFRDLLVELVS